MVQEAERENVGGDVKSEAANNKSRSRCRHFHTLCGCRHTRGALKGRLFQVTYCSFDAQFDNLGRVDRRM